MTGGTIIEGDCLEVLPTLEVGAADLVYLDPPFCKGSDFQGQVGSSAEGMSFVDSGWRRHGDGETGVDAIDAVADLASRTSGPEMAGYLSWVGVRLLEVRRVLAETGSVYLHCDDTAAHYLKVLADAVFGAATFRNHITWERFRGNKRALHRWARNADALLYYARPGATFRRVYVPLKEQSLAYYSHEEPDGRRYRLCPVMAASPPGSFYDLGLGEKTPRMGYRMPESTARRWLDEGRLVVGPGVYPLRKRYLDESEGAVVDDVWTDIFGPAWNVEHTGYPTQKPSRLLRRIVEASSDPGDMVLDPFCGSGTALLEADRLGRRWIGIDESADAVAISRERLEADKGLFSGDIQVAEAAD